FEEAFTRAIGRRRDRSRPAGPVTIVTGELFAPVLRRLLQGAGLLSAEIDVVAVRNDFFGPAISVAGLLTGAGHTQALVHRGGSERAGPDPGHRPPRGARRAPRRHRARRPGPPPRRPGRGAGGDGRGPARRPLPPRPGSPRLTTPS